METSLAETVSASSLSSGITPFSASSCSYSFLKAPGYSIVLSRYEDRWQAMIHDKRFPGLSRSYAAAVKSEKGYRLEDFVTEDSSWQLRHIHIIDNGRPMVYIGSFGLNGGSLMNWFGLKSCTWVDCFNDVWCCVCGYKCTDDSCWYHCTRHYQAHQCSGCGTVDRCPKYYKCQTCRSNSYCSNCCGCGYKQQMQQQLMRQQQKDQLWRQQERDRKERLKQQEEEDRKEQLRRQQKKERKERLKQQEEEDRKEQLRRQQKKERKERLKQQEEEEDRKEQLRRQQEKERKERLKQQEEEEDRKEQLRRQQKKERKERLKQQEEEEDRKEQLRRQQEKERKERLKQQEEEEDRKEQLRRQQEKERKERLKQQEEEEDRKEQLRRQQEKERKERLKQQEEEEDRKEQLRRQQKKERKERLKQQEEEDRKEQLSRQQEKERKERLKQQEEEEDRKEQLRRQQEKERKERLKQQEEEEDRKEQLRRQQEREQQLKQQLKQQQERDQQLKQQQEKEQQLKQQQEKEQQLKQQQEREKEKINEKKLIKKRERQAVLAKLDNIISSAPITQEDTFHIMQNTSSSIIADIANQTNQKDAYTVVYDKVQDRKNQAEYTDQTIDDSDTDSPYSASYNSSNSIFSLEKLNYEKCDSHKEEISNESSNSIFTLSSVDSNLDSYSDQSDDLPISNVGIAGSVDLSLTTSFLTNYTAHLSPEEQTYFYQEFGKFVEKKLPQVDVALQQSIIDYFTNEIPLYPYVVQNYPVSEWIVQSLLKEVLSYANEDDLSLNSFRAKWLMITEQHSISDQLTLLKALKSQKTIHNFSLLDISNILDLILHSADSSGYSIVCNQQDKFLFNLKTNWLQSQLEEYLPSFLESDCNRLCSQLAEMNWGIDMMQQFLKSIQNTATLDPILEFLSTIKKHHAPDNLVLSTIMQNLLNSENKVQQWTRTIIVQSSVHKICQLFPKIDKSICLSLSKLLKHGCSAKLIESVITNNLDLIDAHTADFTKVLELLCDYQVTEEICTLVFSLLPEVAAADWVDKIDALISCELFQDAQVYTTDQLIESIAAESSVFTSEKLKASYNAVMKSYDSPSVVLGSISNKPIANWDKKEIMLWAKQVKLSTASSSSISQSELIAGVKRSVELHCGFAPRDTQLLSLLTLLNPTDGMGRLAQINTGEGKSLIVAMLAAIHALQNKQVDVITTSTELSIPEVKKQKPFFESLALTVAENSNMSTKRSAYKNDVVYGIAGDFQADILRTEFLGQDIRGERAFNIVIVDEVDSMLFDNRSHSVRLSEQAPGMTHLELPLAAIWEHVQRIASHFTTIEEQTFYISEDFKRDGKTITLYSDPDQDWESCAEAVKDKRSFIKKKTQQHLEQLLRELNDEEKLEYEADKLLNNQITTLVKEIANTTNVTEKENKIALCKSLSDKLTTLPWSKRYPVLFVPVHLRDIARSQIYYWINNALNALYGYKKGAHYAVQHGKIVPVHYNETGVLQSNMVWGDGLTQFLQLKEGLRMDPEGVSTNFISNISFFLRYGHCIYGLTGTLGEKSTKDFLRQMYNTDTVVIPPYQHRKIIDNADSTYLCKELVPIVLTNETEWFQTIIDHALSHAQRQRAVLVICKFINQVKHLDKKLAEQYDASKIFTYTGEDTTFKKRNIDSGEIIIATNIAGRGTDLETSSSVESHGGMYVAVTFLPETYRVEMQNVGRTARSGKKGMAQLIINDPVSCDIAEIKNDRDDQEVLANGKAIQDAQGMLLQDSLFNNFCNLENELLPSSSVCDRVQKFEHLTIDWLAYSDKMLSPYKVNEYANKIILNSITESKQHTFAALTKKEKSIITENDIKLYNEKISLKEESKRSDYEDQYKMQGLNAFCNAILSQTFIPEELITCFKEGRTYEPNRSDLAKKYDWGLFDRKGFEEFFGFWLKGEHLEEQDISTEKAVDRFNNAFATPAKDWASKNQLVYNPYFYVLKGNEYIARGNLSSAISCYDRAISMDPDFSVNARYNKAQALLSNKENKGDRQKRADEELKKAKELICTIFKPNLLTFNTIIAQHGSNIKTSEHVQHQLSILSQQENYIDKACAVIEKAQSNDNNVKLTTKLVWKTLNPADQDSHSQAINESAVNGLIHLFTIDIVEPFPWLSIMGMAIISIIQIAAGCLIVACTGSKFGIALISEGISDMMFAIKSAIHGSVDLATWAIQKVIRLAVLIISAGFKSIKNGYSAVVTTTKNLIGKAADGITFAKNVFEQAIKSAEIALGKGVVKECLSAAGQGTINKVFMESLEGKIMEEVGKSIREALLNNPLLEKALKLDVKNGNNYWQNCFIENGLSLLKQQKEHKCMNLLREIVEGVSQNKINYSQQFLEVEGSVKMLVELKDYTNDFIKKFNAKVQPLQSDIESAVQKMAPTNVSPTIVANEKVVSTAPHINLKETNIVNDSEIKSPVYSSKSLFSSNKLQKSYKEESASNPETIVNIVKSEITNKLANSARNNLVNPIVDYEANWSTNKIFNTMDKERNKLHKQVRRARDRRFYSNELATEIERNKKEKENKQNNNGKIKNKKIKLNTSAQKEAEKLQRDVALDANDLASLAAVANAPIRVCDKKTGKLVDIVGDKLPGKPITLLHTKSNGSNSGHWEPLDSSICVESSGKNSCLIDAVFAQFDPDNKQTIQNVNGLKERMIEMIRNNSKEANKAYKMRDKLAKIAPDELLSEGRIPGNEKEWQNINAIKRDLSNLSIDVEFEKILQSQGGVYQFLGKKQGRAEDAFEKLKKKFNIQESDLTHYPNGAKAFVHANKTYMLRADSRKKSGGGGRTISMKEDNNPQQYVVRYEE